MSVRTITQHEYACDRCGMTHSMPERVTPKAWLFMALSAPVDTGSTHTHLCPVCRGLLMQFLAGHLDPNHSTKGPPRPGPAWDPLSGALVVDMVLNPPQDDLLSDGP